jgi:hypothetical protein
MSFNSLSGLCGRTSSTGNIYIYIYIFIQAHWLITATNILPRPSLRLATEAIIRGFRDEAVQKYIASLHT